MMADIAIRTIGLTKRFDDLIAVDHLNFEVHKGEIFGFIGANGAGKTTTIRILTTLLAPTEGSAEIDGYDIKKDSQKVRENIVLVQQNPYALDWFLNVEQNISTFVRFYNYYMSKRHIKDITKQIMLDFGIYELRKKKVITLSGGTQRRIMVARAFACSRPIIFLDEPSTGLDAYVKQLTWDYIKHKSHDEGSTIFLTSHDLNEIEQLCDRVAIIDHGRIITIDKPSNIVSLTGEKIVTIAYEGNINVNQLIHDKKAIFISNKDNKITLGTDDVDHLISEISCLQKYGLKILSIQNSSLTLEDVFIKLVKEGKNIE